MDVTRTCYEAWMRVPEYADPIRVRWYAVPTPAPGSYELTDYCSSDWDTDPKSLDPDLGEQSSTRDPWSDWRDCTPPPWDPAKTCTYCANREDAAFDWTFRAPGINLPLVLQKIFNSCRWHAHYDVGGVLSVYVDATLEYVEPNHQRFTLISRALFGPLQTRVFDHYGRWDCRSDLTLSGDAGSTTVYARDDMPVGAMFLWPSAAALPANHLECDGSAFDPAAYPALSALFPSNTVPDMRGRVPVGANPANPDYVAGTLGGAETVTLGLTQIPPHGHGVTDPGHVHAVTDPQHTHGVNDLGHTHPASTAPHTHAVTDPGHLHNPLTDQAFWTKPAVGGNTLAYVSGGVRANQVATTASAVTGITNQNTVVVVTIAPSFTGLTLVAAATGISVNNGFTGLTVNNAGGGLPHENRQPYIALRWAIRAK